MSKTHPNIFDWLQTFNLATLREWANPLRANPLQDGWRSGEPMAAPLTGLVLFGPPASGKTTVAKALQALLKDEMGLPIVIHDEQADMPFWDEPNGVYAPRTYMKLVDCPQDWGIYTSNLGAWQHWGTHNVEFSADSALALRAWCRGNHSGRRWPRPDPVPDTVDALRIILLTT